MYLIRIPDDTYQDEELKELRAKTEMLLWVQAALDVLYPDHPKHPNVWAN